MEWFDKLRDQNILLSAVLWSTFYDSKKSKMTMNYTVETSLVSMLLKFLTYLTFLAETKQNLLTLHSNSTLKDQYNVRPFVKTLNLEICSFIGIGLKYYAIFVEIQDYERYFLGICHSNTLEMWRLCSPELANSNRRKCRFKVNHNRHYHPRIHRRFCDFKYMPRNEDCQCVSSMFEEDLRKVVGMPTCYVPPLPQSLCRYNICGLNRCESMEINGILNLKCDCIQPFCEEENSRRWGTSRRPTKRIFRNKIKTFS
ncbi:hypothetical protein ABEB36_009059 [Hypothenemus hampei]|uniref:Uncharacterized protein n=1 Tax=Hypothenemus hampei TaxID=57062 RepID=A0ABD1EP21_HYPHA